MTKKIMADERIVELSVGDAFLTFRLADGRILSVPLGWFPRLAKARSAERNNFEIRADGFVARWPALDEDLEISGLLSGNADPAVRHSVPVSAEGISGYREKAGISQRELAIQLGVRQATVSDWEKGNAFPSPLAKSKLTELIRKSAAAETPLPAGDYPPSDEGYLESLVRRSASNRWKMEVQPVTSRWPADPAVSEDEPKIVVKVFLESSIEPRRLGRTKDKIPKKPKK